MLSRSRTDQVIRPARRFTVLPSESAPAFERRLLAAFLIGVAGAVLGDHAAHALQPCYDAWSQQCADGGMCMSIIER